MMISALLPEWLCRAFDLLAFGLLALLTLTA